MYIKRNLEKVILETSERYPVIMLCGQRQVGKSTMLHHIKAAGYTLSAESESALVMY